MAEPLFTKSEEARNQAEFEPLTRAYRDKTVGWREYEQQRQALERAQQLRLIARVHDRADEFLNALIILVGSRGQLYVPFDNAFAKSDDPNYRRALLEFDTPEARRDLHIILRALTEVPKTWARSAFVRFLRGTGKQAGAKYHGAGLFSSRYGWTEIEITNMAIIIAGDSPYSHVLMSYADVAEEIREADPDFEVTDYDAPTKAVRVARDVEFLNQLCAKLEQRGLAALPTPKEVKAPKAHVPREFKPGDIIRAKTIRDLPLPAHIRVNIERANDRADAWVADTLDWVVAGIYAGGFHCYRVGRDGQTAYARSNYSSHESKDWLDGAIYVGPWRGKTLKGKVLDYKFRFRRPVKKSSAR